MAQPTATGTTRDKQNKSYVDSPSRDNFTAQEVYVGNNTSQPIPVDPTTRGNTDYEYNEVQALSGGEITIIDKTIVAGVEIDLESVHCSGDNIAHFIVKINDVIKFKSRSYWSDFNSVINLNYKTLGEGDNIKIIADNKTNKSAFFNASLIFNEVTL